MRLVLGSIIIAVLAGCSSPPKPKECEGEFRPVNIDQKQSAAQGFGAVALCKKGTAHA